MFFENMKVIQSQSVQISEFLLGQLSRSQEVLIGSTILLVIVIGIIVFAVLNKKGK